MVFNLYAKQQEKVDIIFNRLEKQVLTFLTGEVGSGKTYMGTEVVRRLVDKDPTRRILIISPKQVVSKWEAVLESAGITLGDNVVVTVRFNEALINQFDVVIYDEIHTIKSKKNHFKSFIGNPNKHILGLTGTIVDSNIKDVTDITNYFSNKGKNYLRFTDHESLFKTRHKYIRLYIEPQMMVGVSRDDIEEINDESDKLIVHTKQVPITMTNEEIAFYNFMSKRLAKYDVDKRTTIEILNNFLDRTPEAKQFFKSGNLNYYTGELLRDEVSAKELQLQRLLREQPTDVVIYTLNDTVAKRVAKDNDITYVDASQLGSIDLINELVKQGPVVFNVLHVLTGVDIHANHIIWYQTPRSLTEENQGLGRITRLSSKRDDKYVTYLYYDNTLQETVVRELAENHKLNNEMINKQEPNLKKSNLPFKVEEHEH